MKINPIIFFCSFCLIHCITSCDWNPYVTYALMRVGRFSGFFEVASINKCAYFLVIGSLLHNYAMTNCISMLGTR